MKKIINFMSKIVLSPMAGITDAPFRYIARNYGADLTISEMLTAQTQLWSSSKSQNRIADAWSATDPHKIIQIAGAVPEVVADAALNCQAIGAKAVEINMGCPAKKVCNVLAGSALLRDENLVKDILNAAVACVNIPVMLKTRLGWDDKQQNILTIAKIAEDAGIKSLTIHGRTRCDFYNGEADYELIAKVREQLYIPVFVNGDLTTPEKVKQVLDYTQADGAYIGRAALGKPWLFTQIKQFLATGTYLAISNAEKYQVILDHLHCIYQHYGDYMGCRIARKHIKWYYEGLGVDKHEMAVVNQAETSQLQYNQVKSFLDVNL